MSEKRHSLVSVGRPGPWGNPFKIGRDGTREGVVAKHREWFLAPENAWRRELARQKLAGIPLELLWCPGCKGTLPCHKVVVWEVANS